MLASLLLSLSLSPPAPELVVHEWGTFTTVVSPDGQPVMWRPLLGDQDLPRFVHERGPSPYMPSQPLVTKAGVIALVRMETPVVYFYTDAAEPLPVELSVGYREGWLTEWFPRAEVVGEYADAMLRWDVTVLPRGRAADLADDGSRSHYYASRVDEANVVVDEATGETDRLLFYRGVGNARPTVTLSEDADGALRVSAQAPRGGALVVTADASSLCWRPVQVVAGDSRPGAETCGAQHALEARIVGMLEAAGLTPAESRAMVATWEGHWFEPGTRLMSLMPRDQTDALLPMAISPAPTALERVMVERTELLPRAALATLAGSGRAEAEARFGRFVDAAVAAADREGLLPPAKRQQLTAAPAEEAGDVD